VTAIYSHLASLRHEGCKCVVATVVRTLGSTPQAVGAKLVLDDRDRPAGTLGGGCVEADAIVASREILAGAEPSLRAYELNEDLEWNTGLVCGGTMWILVERGDDALTCDGQDMLAELVSASFGGPPLAIVTLLWKGAKTVTREGRMFVGGHGHTVGSLGDPTLDDKAVALAIQQLPHGTARVITLDNTRDLLIDAVANQPRIVVAGGGHVALAIAKQAQLLEFDVTILEDRPEYADASRFPGATVLAGDVPQTLGSLDYNWNTFVVVATRGHKLDADCVLAAARTDARYIGLLGSRRKTALMEKMLRAEGVPEDRIHAIRSPVGLDLGGRTPAEIALAVLAEITQVRYQATGRPLGKP
jgi:xanthine dehydrogenase accessory factor